MQSKHSTYIIMDRGRSVKSYYQSTIESFTFLLRSYVDIIEDFAFTALLKY